MSAPYRAIRDRYLARGQKRLIHELVSPEGIPIRLVVGGAGDRLTAYFLDLLLITLMVLAVAFVSWAATASRSTGGVVGAISILAAFLIRNFYFVWFELRRQGSTPGKRRLRLRVIDRSGGRLRGEAIFARNLTREIEVFLPLTVLIQPDILWSNAGGLAYVIAIVWLAVFALMPLFNRQRLRIGDMVAGTMVVAEPDALLLPDLSEVERRPSASRDATYTFQPDQLDVYGIYELQVLEDLLRRQTSSDPSALYAVCETIKKKIGWEHARWNVEPETFLRDFYAAQRARLEHKMLLGTRQEFKSQPGPTSASWDGRRATRRRR